MHTKKDRSDPTRNLWECPVSAKSYTHNLEHARKFDTREQAEADRCTGNEVVLSLEQVLDRFRG